MAATFSAVGAKLAKYHAISAIGQAVVSLLRSARPQDAFPSFDVRLFQAKDVQNVGEWEGLSLFLYRVIVSGARRQMPAPIGPEGRPYRRPLPLDLFYLLTAWAKTAEMQHLLLAWAMRTIEDSPSLPASLLNAHFPNDRPFRSDESVELIHDPLTVQDLNNIWEILGLRRAHAAHRLERAGAARCREGSDADLRCRARRTRSDSLSPERIGRVAPLGVRFVDDLSGRVVEEGLSAWAWPVAEPSSAVPLSLNGSNVFYLLSAPGLRDLSWGAGDDAYWAGLPRRLGFTVEVDDRQGRFLPFRFTAALPLRGLLRLSCGSPDAPVPLPPGAENDGVPLFTAPTRPTAPGRVVLRADLWDATRQTPAAWAVLEAITPGAALRGEPPARAIADHCGRVALHFAVPDERDFDGGSFDSPSVASGAPLAVRTWVVSLSAAYGALALAPPTTRTATPPIPDLCAALGQPPARLWDRLGPAPREIAQATLRFGQETLIASSDPGAAPSSVLLLTPSLSPP
jgi:hypothetical protein